MAAHNNKNTATTNKEKQVVTPEQIAMIQEQQTMNNVDPRTQAVNRIFDGIESFCEKHPKTAKKIGGTVMVSLGVGLTICGTVIFHTAS